LLLLRPNRLAYHLVSVSSSPTSSLLSRSSPGEAALLLLPAWVPRRSATVHALSWLSSSSASFLYLSSVVGSSCSTGAWAKPSWIVTSRRWPTHCQATLLCRHCRRQASSGAPAPLSSQPISAGGRVDHVGAVTLARYLTAGEESAVKVFLYLCAGCHVGSVDLRVPPISKSS
jgi:hypothetical protein